ncbi:PREDICTED: uncharacterized protein LOC104588837 isoform X3 [Nelumbo nucifera]|uniref:Uncharacterized protein LOC104588837 isoform X3 n=1 Tax=Nelumbo nucifera TaxID=4432 RepID=A0A1U8PYZ0_NELNU|nr:PREDICTED: uncharacterized protein LOC104588837 isoform X3 [Nelumbo nucifera]
MLQVTVCQKCGVTGFPECLIYCSKCQFSAEHRYCLDKLPEPDDENVTWICEECMPKNAEKSFSKKFESSQVGNDSPLSSEEKQSLHACGANSNGDLKFKKQRRRLIVDDEDNSIEVKNSQLALDSEKGVKVDIRTSEVNLYPEEAVVKLRTSQVAPESCQQSFSEYGPAQPIISPVWRGSFHISNKKYDGIPCLVGHVSSKACSKVSDKVNALQPLLGLEMLPKLDVWPPRFCKSPPTDDNIALYFFPEKERDKPQFEDLLFHLIEHDFALKAMLGAVELLIFPSLELPQTCRRFLGKYFLWGVFWQKSVSVVIEMSTKDIGRAEGRDPTKTQNLHLNSPIRTATVSPFSHRREEVSSQICI